jgi:DNA (cytosine-5)-methyltransferase 1
MPEPALMSDKRSDNLVDLFCGGGGSGGGLLEANEILRRTVRGTFVNHWDKAIHAHTQNHPEHRHLEEDLFLLDPTTVFPAGTDCSLLWASPSCQFFSVARGATCVNEQDRSHAHSITDWVRHLRPEAVIVENVPEFVKWGRVMQKRDEAGELMWAKSAKPLKELPPDYQRRSGMSEAQHAELVLSAGFQRYEIPDPTHRGEYFEAWVEGVRALGYDSEHRVLCSADYGDPTIRKRLFIYFARRGSGKRIVWPDPTHAKPDADGTLPAGKWRWRTARDIIDWSLKGASVFARDKELAKNTFRRLAIGLVKFGLKEFLISSVPTVTSMLDHQRRTGVAASPDESVRGLTAGGHHQALAEAFMFALDQTGGKRANAVCLEELEQQFLEQCDTRGVDARRAKLFLGFVVAELHKRGETTAKPWIYVYYSSGAEGKEIDEPLPTVRTKAGHALVYPVLELRGRLLRIDLFYRMLTPLELQRAMGFPDDMRWDGLTQTDQIRAIGNSVSRGVARALGLAWYSQSADIQEKVAHIYGAAAV